MYINIKNKKLNIINAITFKQRLFGLMFKKNISYGMLFKKCNSIHTFFMKEAIDIVAINNESTIIYIEENIKKNKIIKIHNKLKDTNIIELPKGYSKDFKINDKIKLQN